MRRYMLISAGFIVAFVLGVYSGPAIHKTTETKSQIKTVQKDTEKQKKEIVNETIIKRPDGSIETKRTITTDTVKTSKTSKKDHLEARKTEVKHSLPSNSITLMYQPKSIPEYGVMYQRRIFSSLYVGGYVMNNKVAPSFGVAVTLGF